MTDDSLNAMPEPPLRPGVIQAICNALMSMDPGSSLGSAFCSMISLTTRVTLQ